MFTGLKVKIRFLIIFILCSILSYGQYIDYTNNDKLLQFGEHLVNSKQFDDAEVLFNSVDFSNFNSSQLNNAYYLIGWNYYQKKELQLSSEYLIKIDTNSEYYLKSRFFAAYNYIYSYQYDLAVNILNKINYTSPKQLLC